MTENTSKSLYQSLWASADILRSKMDANEYKSYLLGLVFYKYLSDKMLLKASDLLELETDNVSEAQKNYENAYRDDSLHEDLIEAVMEDVAYVIKPQLTFTTLVTNIHKGTFQLEDLAQGFRDIEQSNEIFENLFEDVDLYSKKLGSTPQKQNQSISEVMKELAHLDIAHKGDVLGDAYVKWTPLSRQQFYKNKVGPLFYPYPILLTRAFLSQSLSRAFFPLTGSGSGKIIAQDGIMAS